MQNPRFQSVDEAQSSLNTRLNRCSDSIGKETDVGYYGWGFYTVRILRWDGDNMEELESYLILEVWSKFREADVWALGILWHS